MGFVLVALRLNFGGRSEDAAPTKTSLIPGTWLRLLSSCLCARALPHCLSRRCVLAAPVQVPLGIGCPRCARTSAIGHWLSLVNSGAARTQRLLRFHTLRSLILHSSFFILHSESSSLLYNLLAASDIYSAWQGVYILSYGNALKVIYNGRTAFDRRR